MGGKGREVALRMRASEKGKYCWVGGEHRLRVVRLGRYLSYRLLGRCELVKTWYGVAGHTFDNISWMPRTSLIQR